MTNQIISQKIKVYGVGINDSNNKTSSTINGKTIKDPYYLTWANMIKRCYCEHSIKTRPTYKGC